MQNTNDIPTPLQSSSKSHLPWLRHWSKFALPALLVILLAIPMTLYLTRQEQDIRQEAAGGQCNGNNDCNGGRFCVGKKCVECRNPGSKNDCNGGKVCNQNHNCVADNTNPNPGPGPGPGPGTSDTTHVCPITPADIILVIDNSNSMKGQKLASAKNAARALVDIVSKDPRMRVGIATFDNNGGLNQGLTNNYGQVNNTINSIVTGGKGGTCLECAIDGRGNQDVLGGFAQASNNGNSRHVIILTDGLINRWIKPNGDIEGSTKPGDEKTARDQAENAIARVSNTTGAIFWTVQYGTTKNADYLQRIVANYIGNKGAYYNDQNISLEEIYKAIANEISGGSITAYTYQDANKNGLPDAGEAPLANVATSLTQGAVIKSLTTGVDGKAVFDKLCPGTFTLSVTKPDGYTVASPNLLTKQVELAPGGNITENFAFQKGGPSPVTGAITFNLKFALHGLGIAGDNVVLRPSPCQRTGSTGTTNTTCLNNQKPVHNQRVVTVELIDGSGKVVGEMNGTVEYNNASGLFEGTGTLETPVAPGVYTFRASTPMFLKKKFSFAEEIQPGKTYSLPVVDLTSSDVDNDNRLTILDYNMIVSCYTFPQQPPKCSKEAAALVDVDDNGENNEFDVNLLTRDVAVLKGD